MELRYIYRKYETLKFFRNSNYSEKKYLKLFDEKKYFEMKKMFIPYCEEMIHIYTSYIHIFKYIIPFISLFTLFFSIYAGILLSLITIFTYFFLLKKQKIMKQIYSFEITAINDLINENYNLNVDTDFDELGIQYLESQ